MRFFPAGLLVFLILFAQEGLGDSNKALPDDLSRRGTHWGLLPIGNYTSDMGLTTGVLTRRFNYGEEGKRPFDSLLTVQGSYSTLGPRDLWVAFEKTGVGERDLRLLVAVDVSANPYSRYYGVGSDTGYSPVLDSQKYYFYRQQNYSLELSARKKILSDLDLSLGVVPTFVSKEPASAASLYASDFGTDERSFYYLKLKSGLILEGRDSEFIPAHGYFLALGLSFSPSALGSLPSWGRLDWDYRRYDSLVDDRWLWVASQFRYTKSSDAAPIEEKARLGSLGTLRGLPLGRFLSNDSLSMRTELRSLWVRRQIFGLPLKGGTGVFLDMGRVADTTSGLLTSRTHVGWGISVFGSYFTDDFVGSADLGFCEGSTAFYLRLGHAI